MYEQSLRYAAQIAYSVKETLQNTYQLCSDVLKNNIVGDFIETGVAAGGQIIMMKQALIDANDSLRYIYAFDSFEGIPMPTNKDDQIAGIRYLSADEISQQPKPEEYNKFLKSSGATVHSVENFLNNINGSGVGESQINIIKGWFEYTVPENKNKFQERGISVLRLDGDNYSSTKVVLNNLYQYLSVGGYVIIDDWALSGCQLACKEYFKENCLNIELQSVENSTIKYFKKTSAIILENNNGYEK